MASTPASSMLTAELTRKVRELGVLVWLDSGMQYSDFVDQLRRPESGFAYPVVAFRGSYLELMLALEQNGNGLQPEKVLVHLAGLNRESVKETPVYELYEAGKYFEKSLHTLVREAAVGVARPEEVDAFLRTPAVDLRTADAWLSVAAVPSHRESQPQPQPRPQPPEGQIARRDRSEPGTLRFESRRGNSGQRRAKTRL